jgi:hypothetical protein
MSFAEGTGVSVEKSKLELERLLVKHGAKQYGSAFDEEGGLAIVHFKMSDRHIRLQIPIPPLTDWPDPTKADYMQGKIKHKPPRTWNRLGVEGRKAWVQGQREQMSRTRWRCMLLIVKAKLEHIALGLSDVEREFLADIALPDGRSVAELLKPALHRAYLDGSTPRLLGAGPTEIDATIEEP